MPRVQTLKCGSKRFNIINYCASSGTATQCYSKVAKERVKGAITEVSDSGEGQTKTLSAIEGGCGGYERAITDFHVAFLYPLSIRLEGLYNFLQGKMYVTGRARRDRAHNTIYILN